jgi:hypothetical protein
MQVLHKGWDGLDLAMQGRLPAALWPLLDRAQQEARVTNQPVACRIGGMDVLVTGMGARGGYAWTLDFGPEAFLLWIKRDSRALEWNLRASFRSAFLCTYGLEGARTRFYAALEALGATVGEVAISRIDWCVDLLVPEFTLDPHAFVLHSQTTRTDHYATDGQGDVTVVGRSGKVTGVTCGKMPGRQVVVYDKRREVIATKKAEWWPIWEAAAGGALDRKTAPIWRVELRAGKDCLKDKWNLRSWADLDRMAPDVFAECLKAVRYTVPVHTDENRARWPLHPVWTAVRTALSEGLGSGGVVSPGVVTSIRAEALAVQMRAMMAGMAATYALACRLGVDPEAVAIRVGRDLQQQIEDDPQRLLRSMGKAASRYIFIAQREAEDGRTRYGRHAKAVGQGNVSAPDGKGRRA